ncbi:MAG: Na+/H+ antiporter subunit E [Firmicutes bacterium]|nr:Na+/H+ antiporter subunit E [Bacillota bacterium]
MLKNWTKGTMILFAFWLILSGHFETKTLLAGIIASAAISRICVPLLSIKDRYDEPYCLLDLPLVRFLGYWIWMFKEICKASFCVAKTVVRPQMDIQPQIIEFYCEYCNPVAITLLINSIILTPGTVTIDVRENSSLFVVHALTSHAAEGLLEGTMQRKIGSLFGETVDVKCVRKGVCA